MRFVLWLLLVAQTAWANGRAPGTRSIHFQRGDESHIVAGMTFGLVISDDDGATWHWMCEDAVGYGGIYDPYYVYTRAGTLHATTFKGVKTMRDGCTFAPTTLGEKFISTLSQSADDTMFVAMADLEDGTIYRSVDDGMSFLGGASPGMLNDWWSTVEAAPSNPLRVYATAYRLQSGMPKEFLLYRSNDGGKTYQSLSVASFTTMENSTLEIAGISQTNPNIVFARVTLEDNAIADAIYRSLDGGQSWKRILGKRGSLAFTVRANGALVAGTQVRGSYVSIDNGDNWYEIPGAPHINCLVENEAGEVWACTQNFGAMGLPSDGYGIMKSKDLIHWTGVMKFQDIEGPVACATGTVQKDKCDAQLWCGLCAQLGCDPNRECPKLLDDTRDVTMAKNDGCCGAGPEGAATSIGLCGVVVLLRSRRRNRRTLRVANR